MKRISFFLLVACLLAATAFVFANNKKFAQSLDIYADNNGAYTQITSGSVSFQQLATTQVNPGDPQARLTDMSGIPINLVHKTGPSTYVPVYAQSNW